VTACVTETEAATFQKFDQVTLTKPLPGLDVPVGTGGTVIRVFHWTNPPSYHVFFDGPNQRGWAFLVRGDDALELNVSFLEELRGRP
jgi:hypothetical protein